MLLEVPAALRLSDIIVIMGQTFAYGIFIILLPMTTFVFLKHGLEKKSSAITFALTMCSFALSTASWVVETTVVILKIVAEHSEALTVVATIRLNFHTFVLVNFLLADGVVVWRMRALCGNDVSRRVLAIPVALLIITSSMVCMTIALRIYGTALPARDLPQHGPVRTAMDVFQFGNQLFSLATNVSATGIIARWAWLYRKLFRHGAHNDGSNRQLMSILALLIESGAIYCVSSTFLVLSTVIRTPLKCTLGDIYLPVHTQIAGMYPALIMILVNSRSGAPSPMKASKPPIRSPVGLDDDDDDVSDVVSTLQFNDEHASQSLGSRISTRS